jgi:hypothetical protein
MSFGQNGDHTSYAVLFGQSAIGFSAEDHAGVARAQNATTASSGSWATVSITDSTAKSAVRCSRATFKAHATVGDIVSNPRPKNTISRWRFCRALRGHPWPSRRPEYPHRSPAPGQAWFSTPEP